jgi:hypothetical protein
MATNAPALLLLVALLLHLAYDPPYPPEIDYGPLMRSSPAAHLLPSFLHAIKKKVSPSAIYRRPHGAPIYQTEDS